MESTGSNKDAIEANRLVHGAGPAHNVQLGGHKRNDVTSRFRWIGRTKKRRIPLIRTGTEVMAQILALGAGRLEWEIRRNIHVRQTFLIVETVGTTPYGENQATLSKTSRISEIEGFHDGRP